MFLYSMVAESIDNNSYKTVRSLVLLQHEKDYTVDEFNELVDKYRYQDGQILETWNIVNYLVDAEGFREVPQYKL